jgi:polyisoprenoid-binding protein YceI
MNSRFSLVTVVAAAFLIGAAALPAQAIVYDIDASHSNVGFSVRHLVSKVRGSFNVFTGTLSYDPAAPGKSSVMATIKVSSINTGNERRDNHLRSNDFFGTDTYAEIAFKSTSAKKEGDRLMVKGDLTMHGVTRSVVLPIEVLGLGEHPRSKQPIAGFSAELKLNRSDYGVNSWTDPAAIVGDEVTVSINIEAGKAKDANPCGVKNACNPCGEKNPCGAKNPCASKNPCSAKNPCNPCGE